MDIRRVADSCSGRFAERVPPTHRLFSVFDFTRDSDGTAELAEEGEPVPETQEEDRNERVRLPAASQDDFPTGAYLSDDDIEEW